MVPLDWVSLESSTVQRIKFIPGIKDLCGEVHVEFRTGATYKYKQVPQCHAERMVHSSSPGQYHKDFIRGIFDAERVQ